MKEYILSFFNWCLLNERVCPFILWLPAVLFKPNCCRFQQDLTFTENLYNNPQTIIFFSKRSSSISCFPIGFLHYLLSAEIHRLVISTKTICV